MTDNSGRQQAGRSFHSRYAPEREAERFVEASLHQKIPGTIIVLGPGDNYIAKVLIKRYPWAAIHSIHPDSDFDHEPGESHQQWWPECPTSLRTFLKRALFNEQAAAGVAVLEWEPVMSAYPALAGLIRNEVARALASAAADRATVTYWARSWLKNCLKFASRLETAAVYHASTRPLLLIAAGPSLNDHLDFIRSEHKQSTVWALASAVPALLKKEIIPDMVIATDPGYWSGVHLQATGEHKIPLFMPPSAYCGSRILESSTPIVPLDTGLLFETNILNTLGLSGTTALPFGTSAGTALSLALSLHTGPICLFGLDLAARRIKTHAEPYTFDTLYEVKANRQSPYHAQRFAESINLYPERSGIWRFSRAFSAYANELSVPITEQTRVFRVSDSPVETEGLPARSLSDTCHLLRLRSDHLPTREAAKLQLQTVSGNSHQAIDSFLAELHQKASAGLSRVLHTSLAFSFDEALILKALCGQQAAPALAMAARGNPEPKLFAETALQLDAAVDQWKKQWL